ncbi:MAG: ribosome silencing factor [Acidobacteriota bacterium]
MKSGNRIERKGRPLKSRELAVKAAKAALSKKAVNLVVLDLAGLTIIADYFVICSGESTTQVKAIAEFIEHEFSEKGIKLLGIEGLDYSHWVLLDYGDLIVHVFEKETRDYYELEKLWMDAKTLEIDEDKTGVGGKDKRAVHSGRD